jgi:NhaP-type Na+/H+ or K+/H+ antiporter
VSTGIAKALDSGAVNMVSLLVNPMLEIICSLGLGTVLGLLFSYVEQHYHSRSKRLSLAVTFVILCAGFSKMDFHLGGGVEIGFSSLLVCMMCGTIFCNLCDFSEEIMYRTERWTAPLYVLFFVISGAELDLRVFTDLAIVGIGVVYILFRSAGKIFGASVSAKFMGCDSTIVKNLGITLLPQAGVALGMAMTATNLSDGAVVRNVILFSVLVYELVGPALTKRSLLLAGEIRPEGKTSARTPNKPRPKVNIH